MKDSIGNKAALAAVCVFAVVILGCTTSAPLHYYTLAPLSPGGFSSPIPMRWTLALRPVTVPDILKRPQMLVRTGDHTVRLSENHRWAGPLDKELFRVLIENLNVQLRDAGAVAAPDDAAFDPDMVLAVQVNRFDGRPGESVTLHVQWTLTFPKGKGDRFGKNSVFVEKCQGPDYESLAAAHSRAIAALSREIALEIRAALDKGCR